MKLYAVYNKKNNVYEDYMLYDNGNDLIDDLLYVKEHDGPKPNYLVYPHDYDLYLLATIDAFNFSMPTKLEHSYRGCIEEVLQRNFMDREEMRPE